MASEKTQKIEREIALLKKQQRIPYFIKLTLLFVTIGFMGDMMAAVVFDKMRLMDFLNTYRLGKLLWMGGWWFGFALLARGWSQKELQKKQTELMRLQNSSA